LVGGGFQKGGSFFLREKKKKKFFSFPPKFSRAKGGFPFIFWGGKGGVFCFFSLKEFFCWFYLKGGFFKKKNFFFPRGALFPAIKKRGKKKKILTVFFRIFCFFNGEARFFPKKTPGGKFCWGVFFGRFKTLFPKGKGGRGFS